MKMIKIQMFITLMMLGLSTQAQVSFKDKNGKTLIMVNEQGDIFFQGQKGARVEELGENDENGQNLKFYNKDGELVTHFNAKTNVFYDKDDQIIAILKDGVLVDQGTKKKMKWSEDGEFLVDNKNSGLFLDPNDDLIKDRCLLIAYLSFLTAGAKVEEN